MRLTVLVNNTTDARELQGEAGLSIYIEEGRTRLLLDTGETGLLLANAVKLGIDLGQLDYIVLSHGHYDHSGGLEHLIALYQQSHNVSRTRPVLLTHPQSFNRRIKDGREIGCTMTETELIGHFSLQKSIDPVWITDKLVFLGKIERTHSYEGCYPVGRLIKNGKEEDDYVEDDTALAFKSAQGLVIITGCSHSGICNIIEQAKKVCREERVHAIIGGFHLRKPAPEQLTGTVEYIKRLKADQLYVCHCTDLPSLIALSQAGNLLETVVGLRLEYK